MTRAVIVCVVYCGVLAAAGLLTLGATLPSNILWERTQRPTVRAELNVIAGQNFAFFTRSPESEEFDVYRLQPDGTIGPSLLITPQARTSNLWGLSRTQRAQGPELANLLRAVPADVWADCAALDHAACSSAITRRRKALLRNTSPVPTVCGQVALTLENTVKWAYRRLTDVGYTIERIAPASIDCIHGA